MVNKSDYVFKHNSALNTCANIGYQAFQVCKKSVIVRFFAARVA